MTKHETIDKEIARLMALEGPARRKLEASFKSTRPGRFIDTARRQSARITYVGTLRRAILDLEERKRHADTLPST